MIEIMIIHVKNLRMSPPKQDVEHEIKVMKLLEHPNIIKLYEVGHLRLSHRKSSAIQHLDFTNLHPSIIRVRVLLFQGVGSED